MLMGGVLGVRVRFIIGVRFDGKGRYIS